MKAKEYAEKYKPLLEKYQGSEEMFRQIISNLFQEFMAEILVLAEKRHIARESMANISILNEFSQKWKALANLLPEYIKPEGFKDFWANKIPEIKHLLK